MPDPIFDALRNYWGYEEFRPLQERIVRSILGGHDVAAVMPTGGGKSLCYQLPAVVSGKTAVVVSPLIALMHDQVAQLKQMDIPAEQITSAVPLTDQQRIILEARAGRYRLLYLSPERIARRDTIEWLRKLPLGFFAIDEAHCISEWGHEFRPEYRELGKLREWFPELPIAAFTASATRQVRHDIVAQLRLRETHAYIRSFHRSNLRYVVKECDGRHQLVLLKKALRGYRGHQVIIYLPTIARVLETADQLEEMGLPVTTYHGQMEADQRKRNQESWTSGENPIMVGTIAFGLGINKADVRAVIHLCMPKSVEQYYQEVGRAGRDGEPADCLMLWQQRDESTLMYFLSQIQDQEEYKRAFARHEAMREFTAGRVCRHLAVCQYFGETPKWTSCDACDICGYAPEWLRQPQREPAVLVIQKPAPPVRIDPELHDYLAEWRRIEAARQGVAAYAILGDATLDDLCRRRPADQTQLRAVFGVGEAKARSYGDAILQRLREFAQGARATAARNLPAVEHIPKLLAEGRSFDEIAAIRGVRRDKIVKRLAKWIETGVIEYDERFVAHGTREQIEEVAARVGAEQLKLIQDALPEDVTLDEIRLVAARLRRRGVPLEE